MNRVSIIVPVYNTEMYLRQCMNSILSQTLKDIEIICVDDGSADSCPQICDEYKRKDSRIKVIHKENGGLVSARKAGLAIATGEYIGYVDSDDWIEPDMYERLFTVLTNENVDIAMCGRYEDTEENRRAVYHGFDEGRYDKAELIKRIYPNMIVNEKFFEWGIFPSVWDKLFRRNCLESFQMSVDERITMGEDAACVYPCLLQADSIYILHECLYHYRQTASSMVKNISDTVLERQRFGILYRTVMGRLYPYQSVFDVCEQWRDYLLFLMTPRADRLYRGIEELDYLFPFPGVKKGSNIILYGMGVYGQFLYRYLEQTDFCKVVAVADRNYKQIKGLTAIVISPEAIGGYEFDAIVVAASFYKVRMGIYQDLSAKYPKEKIHIMDETLIRSDETMQAFGLSEFFQGVQTI